MSDRFCPSCGRSLPWNFTKPDGTGGVAPGCYDVPDDTRDIHAGVTCRQRDTLDAAEARDG